MEINVIFEYHIARGHVWIVTTPIFHNKVINAAAFKQVYSYTYMYTHINTHIHTHAHTHKHIHTHTY